MAAATWLIVAFALRYSSLAALVAAAAPELGLPRAALLLLPLSAFLVDASLTLGWRILAGERWWQPHVSHVYQRWVRTGRSHAFVTGVYAMFSIGAVILAAFLYQAAPWSTGGGVALWFLVAITIWLGMRRRLVPRKVNPSSA